MCFQQWCETGTAQKLIAHNTKVYQQKKKTDFSYFSVYKSKVLVADELYRRFAEWPELTQPSVIDSNEYPLNYGCNQKTIVLPEIVESNKAGAETKKKKYTCPNSECNRVFKMKGCLKTHLVHCGKSPRFMCPLCKYRSKWNCYVKSHIARVHNGENVSVIDVYKPSKKTEGKYSCPNDDCRKKYNSKRILTHHINHECEKLTQFKCYYCSFRAHFRDDVKEHSKLEHSDKVCRVNLVIAQ